MHFNGSGGKRKDKDPETGAAFCARGNILFGSAAAKRELGHCLQDGFGVEQDVQLGRKLLAEAAKADVTTPAMDTAVVAATVAAGGVAAGKMSKSRTGYVPPKYGVGDAAGNYPRSA